MAKSSGTKKSNSKKSTGPKSNDPLLLTLFTDSVKDIYWAEKNLVKALPKMRKAATSEELSNAIADHIEVTKGQVARLEQVFELLGKKAQAKKCEAMEGLIKEGQTIVEDTEDGTASRDVGLILAQQKIEHYEIASYGGLAQLAGTLGLSEIADLLGETLSEEKEADKLLTEVAESGINYQAAEEE